MQAKIMIELEDDTGKRFFRSTSRNHPSISEAFAEVAPLCERIARNKAEEDDEEDVFIELHLVSLNYI